MPTQEQIASDIVRNLSEALTKLYDATAVTCSDNGYGLISAMEKKLQQWIGEL